MSKMLEPCPFCGETIKQVDSWARSFDPPRLYHEWHHPAVQCYLNPHGGETQLFCASDDPREQTLRLDAWNKRALRLSADSAPAVMTADERWCAANNISYNDPTMQCAVPQAARPDIDVTSVRDVAISECVKLITELTIKHGKATGTDYEQGVMDHGYRLIHQVRALERPHSQAVNAPALNVKSVCESTKDRRCIEVWLAEPATAADRDALTAALSRPLRAEDSK